jgi:hypothetical protein
MAGQNEIIGIGAEHAQMIAGGAVGAGLRLYLRPAGKLLRNVFTVGICIASAAVFGPAIRPWFDINAEAVGGIVALVSLGVAEGILSAIEKFDFAGLLKRKLP